MMFRTDMHRLTTFHSLRTDPTNLPEEIENNFSQYKEVLTAMLSLDPEKRPTAKDLLQMPLFAKKSKRDLLSSIEDREKQIHDMETRVGDG